jgi:hypothetical protein
VFTEPTAEVWRQIALGWVLHRGPATVTGIVRTLGRLADRHWTVYQKFFYRAAWSLDALSRALLVDVVLPMILESGVVNPTSGKPAADLALDDTTAARYGRHVAHASWFKDASASGPATKGTVIHWAHNWIVGAVTLRLPRWPLVRWVLPVVFCLYRKPADCDRAHPFATRQVLAARMVRQVAAALPGVDLRVAADGQYAARDTVTGLPPGANLVSRIRSDAAVLGHSRTPRSRAMPSFAVWGPAPLREPPTPRRTQKPPTSWTTTTARPERQVSPGGPARTGSPFRAERSPGETAGGRP